MKNFKKIPNFSKYLVNENGEIWSTISKKYMKYHRKKSHKEKRGYLCVGLRRDDGIGKKVTVHSLVCTTYHGERPLGYECDHVNGNPLDNRACNLEWVTPEENARRAGVFSRKFFSTSDCLRMDELYLSYPISYIAKCLNCSSGLIKSSLVSRGIFDGRKNRVGAAHSKISEMDKRAIIKLHCTGEYLKKEIVDKLQLNTTPEALTHYLKGYRSIYEYRDVHITRLYEEGSSVSALSERYSVSPYKVKQIIKDSYASLRKEDIHDPYATSKIKERDLDKLKEFIDEELSIEEISNRFDCGTGAVESALKRFNLKTKAKKGMSRKYDYKKLYEMNLTMPQWKIAKELGTNQPNVAKMIKQYKTENGITGHGNVLRHAERR